MKFIQTSRGMDIAVDDEDYPLLNRWTWSIRKIRRCFYAYTSITGTPVSMHRLILGPIGCRKVIDHIDGNGLNNQKTNIRICSQSKNVQNAHNLKTAKYSRFRGVSWRRRSEKWVAASKHKGKCYNLGEFRDELSAAVSYDMFVLNTFGKLAYTNFKYKMTDDEKRTVHAKYEAVKK